MRHYRADVDGLRAVAIVPVVLFHAGWPACSGGFIGVDVFFVISGFLITGILRQEIGAGTFSIARFYERRIRRLLPALFTVLLVTTALAAWLLLPGDLLGYCRSLLATVFFSSNFVFWQDAGYFAPVADELPLLHTWSLAVEEQFYILFPWCLALVATRARGRYLPTVALVTIVAFALNLAWTRHAADAAFYLAPARAWELGIGALLSLGALPVLHRRRVRDLVGLTGAAAIAWSVLTYSSSTPFPGVAALVPCLGAAAILWAGTGGTHAVGAVLAWRPFVLVGLVSYSLYLWHWPLLALARYFVLRPLTGVEATAIVALAAVAAALSWRYVERPFRGRSGLLARPALFAATLAGMAAFAAFAGIALAAAGWPQRLDADTRRLVAAADDRRPHDWRCGQLTPDELRQGQACRLGAPPPAATHFVVWGDSHARVLADAVGTVAGRAGTAGLLAVRTGCAPLLGASRSDRDDGDACREFNDATLELVARTPGLTDVVLIGRWGLAAEGTRYGPEPGGDFLLGDPLGEATDHAANRAVFERALRRTVTRLRALGRRIWIVDSIPEVGWDVPSVLARARRFGRPAPGAPTVAEFERRQTFAAATLRRFDALPGVVVLHPRDVLCGPRECAIVHDGRPLYFDGHHLTTHGSSLLEPVLAPIFAR